MSEDQRKVALVDDDPTAAAALSVLLEDAGYEAIGIEDPLGSIDKAVARIRGVASAAICDHRLSPRGLASFSGAELVAQLYSRAFPAVLISQYFKIDQNVSIRKYRSRIPILLARDEVGPDQLADAIRVCSDEIGGLHLPHRRGWRTLVRVVAKDVEGGEDVLDAIIPGWRPDEAVRFPAELLGHHRNALPEGRSDRLGLRFYANVNIGAEDAGDLFLEGFEPAIEPQNDNIVS